MMRVEKGTLYTICRLGTDLIDPADLQSECAKCHKAFGPVDSRAAWDGLPYCADCLAAAGLTEFAGTDHPLEELVRFGFFESLWRGVRSAFFVNALFTGTLFTFFLLIRFAYHLSQLADGKPFEADPKTWLYFLAFTWVFLGIVIFPLTVGMALTSRSRSLRVERGTFVHRTAMATTSIALTDCVWSHSESGVEGVRGLFWRRPLVSDSNRTNPKQAFVCGFTDRCHRLWTGYFTLVDVERVPQFPGLRMLGACLLGVVLGGAVGIIPGAILHFATGDPRWIATFTMLGFLDGLLWGFLRTVARVASPSKLNELSPAMRAALVVALIIGAAQLGAMIGVLAGLQGTVVCGIVNAACGLVAWIVFKSMLQKRDTMD